jgi:hypothetical protein
LSKVGLRKEDFMANSKNRPPTKMNTFRFDLEFVDLLNTWSFVSKTEKTILLQEAFKAYATLPQNRDMNAKVQMILENLKDD